VKFLGLGEDHVILPVYAVGMEITDNIVHVTGFNGEDFGVLELNVLKLCSVTAD
jgi:hypothetical protein